MDEDTEGEVDLAAWLGQRAMTTTLEAEGRRWGPSGRESLTEKSPPWYDGDLIEGECGGEGDIMAGWEGE